MTAVKNGTLLVKDSNGNTARVATLSQTDIATLNTALANIGTNSVSIQSLTNQVKTIQGRYVDVDTAQTITGQKTFTAGSTVLKNTNFDALTTGKGEFVNRIVSRDKNGLDCNYINFWQNNDKVGDYKRLSTTSIGVNLNKDDGTHVYGNIHIDGILDKSGAVNFYTYALTPDYWSTDNQIATCEWVRSYIMPAGVIIPFAGSSIPTGYLLCNGAVVSRTTYADLFRVIGTTYGAGDGSTTFKLPDLRDRFLEGAGTNAIGRYFSAGLPNITGGFRDLLSASGVSNLNWETMGTVINGAFYTPLLTDNSVATITANGKEVSKKDGIGFDASRSSNIYDKSSTVQPQSIVVQYLIKY